MSEVVLHAPFDGWLVALAAVPDPVFADAMMGPGLAIEPLSGTLLAPADADVVAVPASAHAVTLRLGNGAELLVHVGLETVALAGRGFRALVAAGDAVRRGQPLIDVDLDAVAAAGRDLVTPLVLPAPGTTLRPGPLDRLVAAGDPIGVVAVADAATVDPGRAAGAVAAGTLVRTIRVAAPHGVHARPAARIVALVRRHRSALTLRLGERRADAASVSALLALGATHGARLEASAAGPDAAALLDALAAFAADRFGDPADAAPAPAPAPAAPRAGPVGASPGLAVGVTRRFVAERIAVPRDGAGADAEAEALDRAVADAAAALGGGDLADAHRAMLTDPALRDAAMRHVAAGRGAGFAWREAIAGAVAALRAVGDARLAERAADLLDVEGRVLARLGGAAPATPAALDLPVDAILIADDLLPSQFQALDRDRLAGICLAAGGPTAHVAILAAAAGVPMLVAAGAAVLGAADGVPAILDADAGTLALDPPPDRLAAARARVADRAARRREQRAAALAPCRTADGVRVEVVANLASLADAAAAVAAGAEGCGLLRTEFLFMDREHAPDEAEQRVLYAGMAAALGDRPLIVRTLDVGGDKPVAYLPAPPEANPALGQRGVRLLFARPDLLDAQLRAILAAVPGDRCRLLLPMVVEAGEVTRVRAAADAAAAAVGRTGPVQIGVMVETPAAAVLADQIAREADFLSVGTNDLTQYALAADRTNPLVAPIVDALHPAVLRLIAQAAAGAAAHGRWLGVCGALASDPAAAALLVGLGVTELSAAPAAIPAVKAAVRAATMPEARALAARALAAPSAAAVRSLLGGGT